MLIALLITMLVLTVALFLVFCRWGRILRDISEALVRLEKGLQRFKKLIERVASPRREP